MQKMLVSIPTDLYRQLRHYSVERNQTQSAIVTEALQRFLPVRIRVQVRAVKKEGKEQ